MAYSTGKLLVILVAAIALAAIAAWLIAWRYRAAVRRLMSAARAGGGPEVTDGTSPGAPPSGLPPPATASLPDNRRAAWSLTALLVTISALIATTSAAFELKFAFGSDLLTANRLETLAPVETWPVLPALAIVWRWSRWRLLGAFAVFLVAACAFVVWRSVEPQPRAALIWLAVEIGPPLVLIALLTFGSATRAIAPWMFPLCLGFVAASIAGLELFRYFTLEHPQGSMQLVGWLGVRPAEALFLLLPWLVVWWPLRALSRLLTRAYANKLVSELTVQFAAVWAVALIFQSLSAATELGVGAAALLLALLWVPLGFAVAGRLRRDAGRPPTLLVLRVFQHDRSVQDLFDHVIERWRLSGNTVLIAGTDLIDRTLDAADVFTFLDGRLASRFVLSEADALARVAEFDLGRDVCGRFRVNECYCHDSSWRSAFAMLAARSDVVLMDLRGFRASNAGCRHELMSLAHAAHVARVVVLTDDMTDRVSADAATAGAPRGRFAWLSEGDRLAHREVLASLFATPFRAVATSS
jgi:hypothetical protein